LHKASNNDAAQFFITRKLIHILNENYVQNNFLNFSLRQIVTIAVKVGRIINITSKHLITILPLPRLEGYP